MRHAGHRSATRAATLLLAAFGAVSVPAATGPQDPRPVFRSSSDLVQVDLTVLDKARVPIGDLSPDEVTVLVDGKPRPIVAFTRVDAGGPGLDGPASPAAAGADAGAPAAAATPRSPADAGTPDADRGRLVTILFDRSIPAGQPTQVARDIALAVAGALGPDDLAAVVRASRFTGDGLAQSFTRDRARLRQAILSPFMGQVAAPDMVRVDEGDIGGLEDGRPDQLSTGDCQCGLCALDAIAGVASSVRDITGRRRVLVWIGSELIVESADIACNFRLRDARTRLFRELDLANLTVHVVDPSGLQTRQLGAVSTLRASRAGQRQLENREEDLDRQTGLPVLPDRTGGRAIVNANAPASLVPRLLDESRVFYLLAFEPASRADGRFHRIEVKVRRKGVTVQARRGYLAPAAPR